MGQFFVCFCKRIINEFSPFLFLSVQIGQFCLGFSICSDRDLSVEKLGRLIRKNILFQEKSLFCIVGHANLWKGRRHLCKYKLVSLFICS